MVWSTEYGRSAKEKGTVVFTNQHANSAVWYMPRFPWKRHKFTSIVLSIPPCYPGAWIVGWLLVACYKYLQCGHSLFVVKMWKSFWRLQSEIFYNATRVLLLSRLLSSSELKIY